MRLLIFLFLMIACLLPTSVRAQSTITEYTPQELQRMLRTSAVSADGVSTITLQLDVPDVRRLPMRYGHLFYLVGSANGSGDLRLDSARYQLVRPNGRVEDAVVRNGVLPPDFPQLLTSRVRFVDTFRLVGMYRGEVDLIASRNESTDGTVETTRAVMTSAVFTFSSHETGGPDARVGDLTAYDPYLQRVLSTMTVNPGHADGVAVMPRGIDLREAREKWNVMLRDANERARIGFARLPRGGIHVIPHDQLARLDPRYTTAPADRIRVFAGKDELAVLQSGVMDNSLRRGGSLVFHVPEDESGLKPWIPLWVVLGGEGEARPRLREQSIPPMNQAIVTSGRSRVTVFEPNHFYHDLAMTAPQMRWGTREIERLGFASFEFTVESPVRDAEGTVTAWFATAARARDVDGRVLVNGREIGRITIRGFRAEKTQFSFPQEILREGTNVLTIENISADPQVEAPTMLALLSAEIETESATEALPMNRTFTLSNEEPTSSTITVRRRPGWDDSGWMMDITDPLNPAAFPLRSAGGSTNPIYTTTVDLPLTRPRFVYASRRTASVVLELSPVDPPASFLDLAPATYLAIAPRMYDGELKRLLNFRATGRAVRSLSVEDIYAAFSYGEVSYHAIRDAIAHHFAEAPGARLTDVLLVGEGSDQWFELRKDVSQMTSNQLPTFGWQNPNDRIRSDEGYSRIAGDGALPDVEIGRISVNTPEELKAVIDKTIAYETNPPAGEWRARNVFVLDDEPEFMRVAQSIISRTFSGPNVPTIFSLSDFPYENYFRGIWRRRSVVMTDRVVDAMNSGARVMVYLGHGGPNLWSGERIFHIRDIDRTVNDGRLPVLLAGSCDTGWIDYPVEPVRTSLSEHFLRHPNGGMVSAFIPVAGTSSYEHDFLLSGWFDTLMNRGVTDLGQLALSSKIYYFLHRGNESVTNQFLMMGDPEVRLVDQPALEEVALDPPTLTSLTGGRIGVQARAPGMDWGMATVVLMNDLNEVVTSNRLRVRNGLLSGSMDLPQFLAPGSYRIVISASGETTNSQGFAAVPMQVIPMAVRVEWQRLEAREEIARAGQPLELRFDLYNESPVDLTGTLYRIIDARTGQTVIETPVSIGAGKKLSPRLPRPLPPGIDAIKGQVLLPADKSRAGSVDTVIAETSVMRTGSAGERFLSLPISAVEVRMLADQRGSIITVPVYNLTTGTLMNTQAIVYTVAEDNSLKPIAPARPVPQIRPGQSQTLTFETTEVLDGDRQRLRFELLRQPDFEGPSVPIQVETFEQRLTARRDLQVVPGSLIIENGQVAAGNTVFFRYRVRNNGEVPVRQVTPALFLDEPWLDDNRAPSATPWRSPSPIPILYPGDEAEFQMRWDPASNAGGSRTVVAAVSSGETSDDANMEDNVASIVVNVDPPTNLRVLAGEVRLSSRLAAPYSTISVTVPFENNTTIDFLRSFRVTAYAIDIDGGRQRVLNRRFEELGAGEQGAVQFDWLVQPGQFQLAIEVNEDREYLETDFADNGTVVKLDYLLPATYFASSDGTLSFRSFPSFGSFNGIRRDSEGSLHLADRPRAETQRIRFSEDALIEGALGSNVVIDRLFGLRPNGHMLLAYGEDGERIKFRFPIDEKGTQIYDVYINHSGDVRKEMNSGQFLYRIEDQEDWQMEARPGSGDMYFGRWNLRDGYLDLELQGPGYPAALHFYDLAVAPVTGFYTSPVVQIARPVPGVLSAQMETPGDTRVEFAVRYAQQGDQGDLKWTDWKPVAVGSTLPPPNGNRYFQWRARLVGDMQGSPRLRSVFFGTNPGEPEGGREFARPGQPAGDKP